MRIVAATNHHLADGVRDGHFCADLYHRLSAYPVAIPPLRERVSDFLVLAGHFLEINRARLGMRSLRLSDEAEAARRLAVAPSNLHKLGRRLGIKPLPESKGEAQKKILDMVLDTRIWAIYGVKAPVGAVERA